MIKSQLESHTPAHLTGLVPVKGHDLPPDLCKHVLSFLEPQDLARAQRVSKNWTLSEKDRFDILSAHIHARRGRAQSNTLHSCVQFLGGPDTPAAKQLVDKITTIRFVTDPVCLRTALSSAQQLQEIDFSSTECTDAMFDEIAPRNQLIQKITMSSCLQMTDGCLRTITDRYPLVHTLNFYPQITDMGLEHVTTVYHATLQVIQIVSPSDAPQVTNRGLQALATCPNLTSLDLAHLPYVLNNGVRAIVQGCRRLKKLRLESLSAISDVSLVAIATHGRRLAILQLRDLVSITDAGLRALHNNRSLTHVSLYYLSNTSREGIQELPENLPSLQILESYGQVNGRWTRENHTGENR